MMADLTHAEKTITVPLSAQDIYARLRDGAEIFEKNRYTYAESEEGFRLEPKQGFSGASMATDSYVFIVTGKIEQREADSAIHLEFDSAVSGVLFVLFAVVLAIVGVVSFFGAQARTGMAEYTRLLPTGVVILLYIGLIGDRQFAINKVIRLLKSVLEAKKM